MTQPTLLDLAAPRRRPASPLDEKTKRIGLQGIARARAVLAENARRAAAREQAAPLTGQRAA